MKYSFLLFSFIRIHSTKRIHKFHRKDTFQNLKNEITKIVFRLLPTKYMTLNHVYAYGITLWSEQYPDITSGKLSSSLYEANKHSVLWRHTIDDCSKEALIGDYNQKPLLVVS